MFTIFSFLAFCSVSPLPLSLRLRILSLSAEKCDEALASPLAHTAFTSSSVFSNGYAPGYAKLNRRGGRDMHAQTYTQKPAVMHALTHTLHMVLTEEKVFNSGTCTYILMNDFTGHTLRGKCPSPLRVAHFIMLHSCSQPFPPLSSPSVSFHFLSTFLPSLFLSLPQLQSLSQ